MSRLWAVTCLFNPAGYRIRAENYRIFRERLNLPLATIELAFDEPFCLSESDAEIMIQVRGGDKMWQKERLLNLAIEQLPDECDQVMWIDADIVVEIETWPAQVSAALERAQAVQPFETIHSLDAYGRWAHANTSMASVWERDGSLSHALSKTVDRGTGAPCSGHVWAARRELLTRHGLYDGCIVGGGDTAFLGGVTGSFDDVVRVHCMGPEQTDRYMAWAEGVYRDVQGSVVALQCEMEHLWHGSMSNRRGRQRHEELAAIGFDPYQDIELDENRIWRWASDRPELHRYVSDYFLARDEDSHLVEAGRA
jgi:hypothetical protein